MKLSVSDQNNRDGSRYLPLAAAVGFCILYGLQIVLQSLYLRSSIRPLQLMFLTNATAFVMLTAFHSAFNRKIFRLRMPGRTAVPFVASTALWIVADISSMIGLSVSPSINLSILSRLQVFITYVGAVLFLGETFTYRKVLAILLAFTGSLLTVYSGAAIRLTGGDILFLLFTVAISVSGLLRQKASGAMDVHRMTYLMYGISSVVTGIIVLVADPGTSVGIWGFIFANALLALLGFTCVNYSIGKGGAAQFSLVSNLLPFVTAVFAAVILAEVPTPYQIAGGVIIFLSIALFINGRWKKRTA